MRVDSPVGRMMDVIDVNYGTHRGLVRSLLGEAEYISGRLSPFLSMEPSKIRRLVFVCLGNINRSAFAGALAQTLGASSMSIGLNTTTGAPAFERAILTARYFGVDLTSHSATDFRDFTFIEGDILLAMEVRHARELLRRGIPSTSIILLGHWARPHRIHIHDPHMLSKEYFISCFSIIRSAVFRLLADLRND